MSPSKVIARGGRSALEHLAALPHGERLRMALAATHALLIMIAYYVLKTVREPLLLAGASAELKSYAQGAIAAVLLVLVPCIAPLMRRFDASRTLALVTVSSIAVLGAFGALGNAGFDVGFAYYVWVGVFGVTILAQFWSHAARGRDAGHGGRALALVMGGASLGGLIGPPLTGALFPVLGPWRLLALGAALLALTLPLIAAAGAREQTNEARDSSGGAGIGTVLRNSQLRSLAALVIVVNCVNSMGEYLLSGFVLRDADERVAADPSLDRSALVAAFYGDYFLAVNVLTVALQLTLVRRLIALGGRTALVAAPLLALGGYCLAAIAPAIAVLRAVKLVENAVDYSLVNTLRQVLYLDHAPAVQRQGRAIIDTFCYRVGDLLQAALVAFGVLVGLAPAAFAWLNVALAASWLTIALKVGRLQQGHRAAAKLPWRSLALPACCAAATLMVFVPGHAAAATYTRTAPDLFAVEAPLELSLELRAAPACRGSARCTETAATLSYRAEDGAQLRVAATVRTRGQWRAASAHCSLPPLFVALDPAATVGTVFAGHTLLPLTTHCSSQARHEQYVLKEYLAYRIYGALTEASLRVRLARITYLVGGRRAIVRYAFFTENFATFAARRNAVLASAPEATAAFDVASLATLELFEYLIGNTDFSIVGGHNVARFAGPDGRLIVVPYDFDFAGIVGAHYATPSPRLPIASVTQRLFRGICRKGFDWRPFAEHFVARRAEIDALVDTTPGLGEASRKGLREYLAAFHVTVASPSRLETDVAAACRHI